MATEIFVNLPVRSLPRSIAFFERLGFTFDLQFTDETATCMVIGEHIFAMLLTHEKFKEFTPHPICDANAATEVLLAVSQASRGAVDDLVDKAVAAGATDLRRPQDHGFMYHRAFQDLDGHIWEIMWMDRNLIPRDAASTA